jgi:hypothetical protein
VLYVSDPYFNNVYRVTLSNGLVSPPLAPLDKIYAIRGIALDSNRQMLYIVCAANKSVGIYHPACALELLGVVTVAARAYR